MLRNIIYFFRYISDKKVPLYKRGLIFASLLYFVLPTDIVPDFILALGWLDDAAVAAFIWNALRTEISDYIAKQKSLDSKVVDLEDKKNKN